MRGKDTKLAKKQARKDHTEQGRGNEEKELVNGREAGEMMEARKEARKAPRAANLIGRVTKTKGPMGTKAKAKVKARVKHHIGTISESRGTSD